MKDRSRMRSETKSCKAALAYMRAGLSVIPIRTDGTKALALKSGERERYESTLATENEIRQWFAEDRGVAILCGKASGNLECVDFDVEAETLYPEFASLIGTENPSLMERITVNQTPRPGYHLIYRVAGEVPGSDKLASRSGTDPKTQRPMRETMIETRGNGGYFIAPGSAERTHESGRAWKRLSGPKLPNVETISLAERDLLVTCARSFNRVASAVPSKEPHAAGLRPGDDYDKRGPDWSEILTGWEVAHQRGNERYWRRPGKTIGWSATTSVRSSGVDLLYVFSSNAHPFESEKLYGKFAAFVLLHHNGDWKAAARAAGQSGYGEQRKVNGNVEAALRIINRLTEAELNEVVARMERETA
jgi:putative DNA primase/helicase